MYQAIKIEFLKTKRLGIVYFLLGFMALSLTIGTILYTANQSVFIEMKTQWIGLWGQLSFFYAQFFMPITISLLVSVVYKSEYSNRNWQRLKSIGISPMEFVFGKFCCTAIYIFFCQTLFTIFFYIIGFVLKFPFSQMSAEFILWSITAWIGALSIISIQLWLSVWMKNFTTPILLSVVFTVVGVMLVFIQDTPLFRMFPYEQIVIGIRSRSLVSFASGEFIVFIIINVFITGILYFLTCNRLKKDSQ